jgi:hypothetical protein
MECAKCRELKQVLEFRVSKYVEACASAYYRVSTELAARKNVDMERSRNDLKEHQLVCASLVDSHALLGSHLRDSAVKEGSRCHSHLSAIDQSRRTEFLMLQS